MTRDQDQPPADQGGGTPGAHRLRHSGILDRWYLLLAVTVAIALVPVGYAVVTDDGPKQSPSAVLPSMTAGLAGAPDGASPSSSGDPGALPVSSESPADTGATPRTPAPKAPGTTSSLPATLTISATAVLQRGQSWRTTSTALALSTIGDLIATDGSGRQLWHSDTGTHNPNRAGTTAVFQNDGNLVVYDSDQRALWTSGTAGHPGAVLVIQRSGVCVVDHGRQVWCGSANQD
jgi:hypothetical protein